MEQPKKPEMPQRAPLDLELLVLQAQELQPGDLVILSLKHKPERGEQLSIEQNMRALFPRNQTLITAGGSKLKIVRPKSGSGDSTSSGT